VISRETFIDDPLRRAFVVAERRLHGR